jgi:hypothetical protein
MYYVRTVLSLRSLIPRYSGPPRRAASGEDVSRLLMQPLDERDLVEAEELAAFEAAEAEVEAGGTRAVAVGGARPRYLSSHQRTAVCGWIFLLLD